MTKTRILTGLREITDRFDLALMDLWGCMHDGVTPYPAALDCLKQLQSAGKQVAILSNAPRHAASVIQQLNEMGIPRALYSDLFASGEETWRYLKTRPDALAQGLGRRVYPLIAARDERILDGLDLEVAANVESADFLLVTGVADATVKATDFDPVLAPAARAKLPLVCANPDLIVHRGGIEEICAGAIAARYEELGGRAIYNGKPHRRIYEIIFEKMGVTDPGRVIGIGDSFRTDVRGAAAMGAGSVLIAGGIHHAELLKDGKVQAGPLAALTAELHATPDFVLPYLAW
jgi:HAD superfamily hydrolase (TIGR01459 family)